MSKALFAGSFNPFTSGHSSVVKYADEIFKSLGGCAIDIGITQNPSKPTQNLHLLKWVTNPVFEGFASSRVKIVDKPLLVEYMKENDYSVLVRSFRNAIDIIPELDMAVWNQKIGNIRTMYVPADRSFEHISSSAIRDLDKLGVSMKDHLATIQYARWKAGTPKRIIVVGDGMGCGKSSFIKDYAPKILDKSTHQLHWCTHDMDQVVKDRLSDESKFKFRSFFMETPVDDIYMEWYIYDVKSGLDVLKAEVEEIIVDYIDEYTGIFEVSAFTAYDLQKYYDDSIIVYVKKYDSGKVREIDPIMYEKTKILQGTPIVVDFVIDDLDDNFQNTVDAIIKTYRG